MLPEELELKRLESEEAELEEQVASAELMLESSKVELNQFHYRYYRTVGDLFLELDALDAAIAAFEARQAPFDADKKAKAGAAEEQARKTAQETEGLASESPPPEMTPEIKQAYRKATRLIHPDRATSESERQRRTALMARVNRAYEAADLAAIEKLIVEFGQDPESLVGDDTGTRLVKTIRRIAQLRRRLTEAEQELADYESSELYELMATVHDEERQGRDPLGDLQTQLRRQIDERKIFFDRRRSLSLNP